MGDPIMSKTIEALSKEKCTGCKACADACPVQAIEFYNEADGFWYPQIHYVKCVSCGNCYDKCPCLNDLEQSNQKVLKCYGAKTKNEEIRLQSTSGGVFSEFAIKWIEDGGIIVGAEYDELNLVHHAYSSKVEDIRKFRQSKYVQSDTVGIYRKVKNLLSQDQKILFCGTPCQVEALLLFLGGKYKNLLTLDFVCCGICSPGMYQQYLAGIEKKYHSKVTRVWFKNKKEGWRSIGTRIDLENGKQYYRVGARDLFMTSFVSDALSMRLSCEECKYRKLPHNSDITLGDFWGIEKINPSFDDNKGLSAVLLNSIKGVNVFASVRDRLDYFETTKEEISQGNFTIFQPKHINPLRREFVELMNQKGFRKAMAKYSKYSGLKRIRTDISYYKEKIKRMLKK